MSFNSLWGVTWTAAWQMGQATRQVPLYLNSGGGSDGVTRFQLTAAWFPQREAGHGLSLPMLASCSAGNRSLPQAADRQPPGHRLILLLHPQPSANGEASSFQADLYGGVPAVLRFQGGWEMLYQTCHTVDDVSKKELDLQRETRQTIYKTAHGTSLWTWVSHRKQPNK